MAAFAALEVLHIRYPSYGILAISDRNVCSFYFFLGV